MYDIRKYFFIVWKFCYTLYQFLPQNPGYMKDNFVIMIESFHIGDCGNQHNVSAMITQQ